MLFDSIFCHHLIERRHIVEAHISPSQIASDFPIKRKTKPSTLDQTKILFSFKDEYK